MMDVRIKIQSDSDRCRVRRWHLTIINVSLRVWIRTKTRWSQEAREDLEPASGGLTWLWDSLSFIRSESRRASKERLGTHNSSGVPRSAHGSPSG